MSNRKTDQKTQHEALDGSHNKELLTLHISTIVPFMILDILQTGGIKEHHLREAQRHMETIASQGDLILYRSKKKGETAHAVRALCRLLAIGAFAPGGIIFLGIRFEEDIGKALEHLFAQFKLEDFEALKAAMEAEEKREAEKLDE